MRSTLVACAMTELRPDGGSRGSREGARTRACADQEGAREARLSAAEAAAGFLLSHSLAPPAQGARVQGWGDAGVGQT
eukprot:2727761-Rhodomonas_salina.3